MAAGQKHKRRVWLPLAVGAALLLVGFLVVRSRGSGGGGRGIPAGVAIAKAEVGTQQQRIAATGVVASQIGTQVKIGSQITGRIKALPADVGTHVKAGQVIAVLDAPDMQAQVEMQRQAVAVADASLAQAKSRLQQAVETAGYTKDQTAAQIAEADAALRAAQTRVDSSAATARLQPTQTETDIRRGAAALSTAKSSLSQADVTARQQIQQSQSSVDDAQVALDNARKTFERKQKLLARGFVAAQESENAETSYRQAVAKLDSAKASLAITREKVRADVQMAEDTVKQAQASLESAQAGKLQDAVSEANLRNARETLRQSAASLKLSSSNQRLDRIKSMAANEARTAVAQARASVLQARAQLSYQEAQLAKAVIRSPIDGTVLSITAQQGETVAAGFSAPTLITVADLNKLEVRAYVDETDIGRAKLHLPAEVRIQAFPGRVFRGEVTKIASASTVKDNVVTYETTIAIRNSEGLLRPDMTADVSLILGEFPNVVMVPSESVHRETTRTLVYVLHNDRSGADRVEVRTIQIGLDDGARTAVTSGLKKGETVVVAGLQRLGVRAPDSQRGAGTLMEEAKREDPGEFLMELTNVHKVYVMGDQEVRALDGVDLRVREGEFRAIMGPSGSGKSTLMHIMGCLDAPTEGSYKLSGDEVSNLEDAEMAHVRNKMLGFVFQSYNLLPSFTALENVELPMIYGGVADRRNRARTALERVGLSTRMGHKPAQLSGGQQQRVAIARAIAAEPRVLMADEPTGNVATRQGEEIMAIFQELNDQGITVILVTHEPHIARHARSVVQMQDGRIMADQPISERIIASEWLALPRDDVTAGPLNI